MTTAIIGVGNIGKSVSPELVDGGERVVLAARYGSHATALANELGELASATSVENAITDADVVVFAVWLDTLKDLIAQHSDLLRGKSRRRSLEPRRAGRRRRYLSDASRPPILGVCSRRLLPAEAHFVKAFGTLGAESLASEANRTPRAVLFYATDDDQAAAAIERLISAAGFDPVKAGGVDAALRIETSGDLHQFGGLNGKVLNATEARTAVRAAA